MPSSWLHSSASYLLRSHNASVPVKIQVEGKHTAARSGWPPLTSPLFQHIHHVHPFANTTSDDNNCSGSNEPHHFDNDGRCWEYHIDCDHTK